MTLEPAEAAPDATPAAPPKRRRLRAAFDRVPTSWLSTALVVVLLGVSAAFGGLADAPTTPIAALEAGERIDGAQLDITVLEGVVVDELPGASLEPEAGNRFVMVVAEVENVSTAPAGSANFDEVVALATVSDEATTVLDIDDGREWPTLQVGVPRTLAWVWELPAEVSDAAAIGVEVFDRSYYEGTTFIVGASFEDPFLVAAGELRLRDGGVG